MATVGEVLNSASYGTSQKASEAGDGLPVIRMGNVTMDGQLDTADLKYIELTEAEREKAELLAGDLLFNRREQQGTRRQDWTVGWPVRCGRRILFHSPPRQPRTDRSRLSLGLFQYLAREASAVPDGTWCHRSGEYQR